MNIECVSWGDSCLTAEARGKPMELVTVSRIKWRNKVQVEKQHAFKRPRRSNTSFSQKLPNSARSQQAIEHEQLRNHSGGTWYLLLVFLKCCFDALPVHAASAARPNKIIFNISQIMTSCCLHCVDFHEAFHCFPTDDQTVAIREARCVATVSMSRHAETCTVLSWCMLQHLVGMFVHGPCVFSLFAMNIFRVVTRAVVGCGCVGSVW